MSSSRKYTYSTTKSGFCKIGPVSKKDIDREIDNILVIGYLLKVEVIDET